MELIHVVFVDEDSNMDISTFSNIDEQDTSGTKLAEEEFLRQIMDIKASNRKIDNHILNVALEDGYYNYNAYHVYLYHNTIENLQT